MQKEVQAGSEVHVSLNILTHEFGMLFFYFIVSLSPICFIYQPIFYISFIIKSICVFIPYVIYRFNITFAKNLIKKRRTFVFLTVMLLLPNRFDPRMELLSVIFILPLKTIQE